MIAVTVVSPKYRKVAKEAIRRFKKFSGITPTVIHAKDGEDGFFKKLALDKLLPRKPVVFFDADWWLLCQQSFERMTGDCFYGVHDSATFNPAAFPHTDCETFSMPKLEYFNTGFFVCDFSNQKHRQVFQVARRLKVKVDKGTMPKPVDKTDQFYINLARLQVGVGLNRLPANFNLYLLGAVWGQQAWIPRNIVGLHGAGIPAESKFEQLSLQAQVFSYEFCPMHPEAMAWECSRMIDLR